MVMQITTVKYVASRTGLTLITPKVINAMITAKIAKKPMTILGA